MDNYDEKLNYSFEPADPAPAEPAQPLQQAKEEIRRSGRHTGLKIAALLTVVGRRSRRIRAEAGDRRAGREKPRRAADQRRRHGRADCRAGTCR